MEETKKKMKSRDAARQRRGQQNDEFSELASSLPLSSKATEKLDRLCVMRLSTSYIKNKHVLQQIKDFSPRSLRAQDKYDIHFNKYIQKALGGFIFVLAEDGQCLYISSNVNENLGLQQLDITGHSFYKYIHPCDQGVLAKQLGGQVPLEDMEIFDGMFCSDTSQFVKNPKQAISSEFMNSPHRSFFLRMKSTLTSRGKSVNINASIYRVVHCSGTMQMYRTKFGVSDSSMTRCMIGVGLPLMSQATFEVPVDRQTFITKHSLDFAITEIEDVASEILGYKTDGMKGVSWYLFSHICDAHVLKSCHDTLLKIGQAVSGYYRVMTKCGGWIWMQTKANVVYVASTGQPQHIMCVHYVISGVELDNHILSTEQLITPGIASQKKRTIEVTYNHYNAPALKYNKISTEDEIATSVYVPSSQGMPHKIEDETENDDDEEFDDLPGLEFLDVTDGFPNDCFPSRSPFIPPPFQDASIKSSGCTSDEDDEGIPDECEMMNRAPYIPPPCIDKILSFDDLDLPNDMNEELNLDNHVHHTNIDTMIPTEFYDFGHARVPYHLVNKYVGKKDQPNQIKVA